MAKNAKRDIVLKVSEREFDAILAGLRLWQSERERGQEPMMDIATEHGKALSSDEVDDLCERINCGG